MKTKKLVAIVMMLVLLALANNTPVMASEESSVEDCVDYDCSPAYEREADGMWFVIVEVYTNGEWTDTFGLVFKSRWAAELYRALVTCNNVETNIRMWKSKLGIH